jgi:hypothetical protein
LVPDTPQDRAVEVVITVPDGVSCNNLQEMAEKAWRSPKKSVTENGVTVKVRAFPSAASHLCLSLVDAFDLPLFEELIFSARQIFGLPFERLCVLLISCLRPDFAGVI